MAIVLHLPQPAHTIRGYTMQLDVHPWGLDGGSWLVGEPAPGTVEWDIWLDLHNRRYGPSETGERGAVSFGGLKQGEWAQFIEVIWAKDPDWFANHGIEVSISNIPGMGRGEATKQATFDAQAWSKRDLISDRGRELNMLDGPGPEIGTGTGTGSTPTTGTETGGTVPPPILPGMPIGPPLSPLSVRVEELRQIALSWLSSGAPIWILALFWRRSSGGTWDSIEETIKGALRTIRYMRRLGGDTRAIPPE